MIWRVYHYIKIEPWICFDQLGLSDHGDLQFIKAMLILRGRLRVWWAAGFSVGCCGLQGLAPGVVGCRV